MKVEKLNKYQQYLNEIAAWHYNEWHSLYPGSTINDFIRDLQDSLSEDTVPDTWVLIDEQEVIGSASILKQDMTTNTSLSPWLANVFVKPEHRGKGFGKFIITAVMNEAKKKGLSVLYLFTENQSQFYKKLGWEIIKQEKYHKINVSVMSVNLREYI